jgi:hypothetical protein
MKQKLVVKITDLEKDVINEFRDRCRVTSDDVRQRVESLISRSFVQRASGNRIRYIK